MIKNYQITKHFSLYEMTDSTDYPDLVRLNRKIVSIDYPGLIKLAKTCKLLEEVRLIAERPMYILSGFRCSTLNVSVNGSVFSQHMKAEAADFTINPLEDVKILFSDIRRSDIKYHQLIYYPEKLFIHISLPTGSNDQQAFERV